MKLSLIALATLLSSQAFALQVGDGATYTVSANGQSINMVMTVTQISGDAYTAQAVLSANGQTQTQVANGSLAEIEQINQVFQNCNAVGGNFETVAVGAQSISTCHINQNGEEIFVSPEVTFGIVKSISSENGVPVTIALSAFRKQ